MATSVLEERKRQLVSRGEISITGAPATKIPDRYTGTGRYSGVVKPKGVATISPTYVNPEGE